MEGICKHPGCKSPVCLGGECCSLHMHEEMTGFGGKVFAAASGAYLYATVDTTTLNSGIKMTDKWVDKADTKAGKVAAGTAGTVLSTAGAMGVQAIKTVGRVGKFFVNIFDNL